MGIRLIRRVVSRLSITVQKNTVIPFDNRDIPVFDRAYGMPGLKKRSGRKL